MKINWKDQIRLLVKNHDYKYCLVSRTDRTNVVCFGNKDADKDLDNSLINFLDQWDRDQYVFKFRIDKTGKEDFIHRFDTYESGAVAQGGMVQQPVMDIAEIEKRVEEKMTIRLYELERKKFEDDKAAFNSTAGKLGLVVEKIVDGLTNKNVSTMNSSVNGSNDVDIPKNRNAKKDKQSVDLLIKYIDSDTLFLIAKKIESDPKLLDKLSLFL